MKQTLTPPTPLSRQTGRGGRKVKRGAAPLGLSLGSTQDRQATATPSGRELKEGEGLPALSEREPEGETLPNGISPLSPSAGRGGQGGEGLLSRDPATWVRPEVRALAPYHLDLTPCAHKLDQNEMPYEPPRRLKKKVLAALMAQAWARYPDFHADALRERLGERYGWPADGVLVGNGSNELLATAIETLIGPGEELLTVAPSFGLYKMFATRVGAKLRTLPCDPGLRLPLAALQAEAERAPRRALLLCTPNNPTGEAAPRAALERLAATLDAPLLLDNAYGEFGGDDPRPLLERHRNVLLFRTFSKAWSLGRARLGYLLGDPELLAAIRKVKLPYNLGLFAQAAGLAALDAEPAARRRIAALVGRRRQLALLVERRGFRVYPSDANFLLAEVPSGVDAGTLWRQLNEGGIRVRDFTRTPGLERCLRFSAGDGRDLRALARALDTLLPSEDAR